MRYLPILLFLLCSIIPNENLQATHALGGDLIYEQIGPNEYFITLRIYRDCNGIALNNTEDIEWMSSCGSGTISAARISDLDITPLCPGSPTACNGGTGSIGIEEHVYTATVTLPNNCTDVNFNYTLCCRNHIITTLIDPGNENIFLYATHQNTSISNHSPIFNNYPSPIVCVNQPVLYNHGVSDPDGDSLYFSAGNCYEALNDTVEYLAGYNGVTPLTTINPIILNPNTGSISFTPNIQQVGVMCILVEEFRNGVKIGETIRDIQFNVIACANVPPVASGINNLPGADSLDFVFNICESNAVCFDLSFSDPDIDILNVSWNGEIAGATFQVSGNNTIAPTAQFCWSPQPSDVGLNYFSVNITDDACPLVGSSTYTYTVDVLPNPNTMTLSYANLICNSDSQEISLFPSSTIDSLYWTPNPSLSALPNGNGLAYPTSAETYIVRAYFPDGCYVEEQAPIAIATPPSIQANANTSNICNGGTVVLNGSGGLTYTWSGGVTDNVPFTPSPGFHTYVVTGVDADGCTNDDSVTIQVNPIVTIVATPDTNICNGQTVSLSGQGALSYTWNNGIQNAVPFIPSLGTTNYVMTATDVNGCIAQDSIAITANPLPNVQAMASSITICEGDSLSLTSSGVINPIWSNGVTEGVRFIPVVGTQSYAVSGSNSFGCLGSDSIVVQVNALPNINITASDDSICEGSAISIAASGASTFTWSNGIMQNSPFTPSVGFNTYVVNAIDANACEAEDSIGIMVNPLPVVSAVASDSVLCDGESISITASGAQTYTWSNGMVNGSSFTPLVGAQTYTVVGIDANNCQNQASINVAVNPNPNIVVQASTNGNELCAGETAVLTASGAPSLTWNNGIVNGQAFTPPLGNTNYVVNAENIFGCTANDSVAIIVNPLPVVNAVASANDVCYGDSIMLQCPGNVQHNWSNGVAGGVNFLPPVGLTTYTLTIIDSNLCENSDSVDVNVFALPTVTATSNESTICEGQTVALFAAGAQSYTWSNGVSTGVPFTPSVGLSTFNLVGVDVNGCSADASVDILTYPSPLVSLNAGDTSICQGVPITLTGSGADTYVWNNGVIDGQTFVPNSGLFNYVVTGTDTNGCNSSDSILVEVNALPAIVASASDSVICDGEALSLTASGAQTYIWDNGVINGSSFTPLVGTQSYTVVGIDTNNCQNQAVISIAVNPNPNIVVQASTNGNALCDGETAILTAYGAQNLTWNNGVVNGQTFTPPLGNTNYVVNAENIFGCTTNDSIEILVNPLPVVDAQASANDVCFGDSIMLVCAGNVLHYWDNGVIDGVNFLPPMGITRYTLNIVDSNLCENSDSVDVRVFALPNVTAAANDSAVCDGQTIALFASGAQNYTWSNGLSSGTPFTPPLGQSTYTVLGVDTNGCSNTADIQIVSNPNPSVSLVGGDTSVCFGEAVVLTGAGADDYVWNNGVADGQSFVPNSGIHEYIVIGTDNNGCSSSDSVQVEVFELPNVIALSSDDSICIGESIQLTGSGAISYSWTNGISDGDSIMPSLGATTYTVVGMDANLCENMAEVMVHAIPLGTLDPLEDLEFCDVNELEVRAEGENLGTYQWGGITSIGGFDLIEGTDYLGTQSADLGIYNLLSASNHTFYVNAIGVCGNQLSDTFQIISHQSPKVDILGDTSLCSHEDNVIITNAEGFNFTWNDGTQGQLLSPNYSGMFYVEFEEYNTGCIISDTLFIQIEDCIDQCVVLAPTGFSPNNDGANDGFKVVSTCGEGFSYFNLMIYNRWGEKVFQTDDPNLAWDGIYKGKPAEISTYAYAVEYTKEYSQDKEMLKGNVTLVK